MSIHQEGLLDAAPGQVYAVLTGGEIAKGRALLERATALGGTGPHVLQAAVAELHITEPRDWEQIALLYGAPSRLTGSPVVEVNRAVAVLPLHARRAAATAQPQRRGAPRLRSGARTDRSGPRATVPRHAPGPN